MISINKQGNAIVIEFTDNDKYLFNGKIEVAPNELIVVTDDSEMATFKKASNGDVLFSQLISDIQIAGSPVTKDTIIDQFATIGFISGGGSGEGAVSSVNGQTGDVVITPASLNVYNKTEVESALEEKQEVFQVNSPMAFSRDTATQDLHLSIDLSGYATKEELADKQDAGDYATKTELQNVSAEVEHKADKTSVYTMQEVNNKLATKQATLVQGDNITLSTPDAEGKVTISATGLATIQSVEEISGEVATLSTDKQDKLVSGTNIKTINGNSILGEGNIEITGGGTSNKTWNFTGASDFLTDSATSQVAISLVSGTISYGEVSVGDNVILDDAHYFVVLNKYANTYSKYIAIMPIYDVFNNSNVLGYVMEVTDEAVASVQIYKVTMATPVTFTATANQDIRVDTTGTAGISLSGFTGYSKAKPGDVVHITYSTHNWNLVVIGKYTDGTGTYLVLSGLGNEYTGYRIGTGNIMYSYVSFDKGMDSAIAIGRSTTTSGTKYEVAIGVGAATSGKNAVAIGAYGASANTGATAIGADASANENGSTVIGANLKANDSTNTPEKVVIGYNDTTNNTGIPVIAYNETDGARIKSGSSMKKIATADQLPSSADITKLQSLPNFVTLTQTEYEALETKDANTVYLIKEA